MRLAKSSLRILESDVVITAPKTEEIKIKRRRSTKKTRRINETRKRRKRRNESASTTMMIVIKRDSGVTEASQDRVLGIESDHHHVTVTDLPNDHRHDVNHRLHLHETQRLHLLVAEPHLRLHEGVHLHQSERMSRTGRLQESDRLLDLHPAAHTALDRRRERYRAHHPDVPLVHPRALLLDASIVLRPDHLPDEGLDRDLVLRGADK